MTGRAALWDQRLAIIKRLAEAAHADADADAKESSRHDD